MKILPIVLINFLCKFDKNLKREKISFKKFNSFRYKGKGTSRSDEIGDESRVYTKFKVSLFLYSFVYSFLLFRENFVFAKFQ